MELTYVETYLLAGIIIYYSAGVKTGKGVETPEKQKGHYT